VGEIGFDDTLFIEFDDDDEEEEDENDFDNVLLLLSLNTFAFEELVDMEMR
jgi:hypothetical protein